MTKKDIISILIGLILTAYGFIFSSIVARIDDVEQRQAEMNPVLLTIQTQLAEIKKDLEWIKKSK